MKNLKVLNLSIPTLDSSECKALMGGDGYIWGGELDIDVIIRPDNDQPERPDYDLDDDNQDYNQDDYDFDSDDSEEYFSKVYNCYITGIFILCSFLILGNVSLAKLLFKGEFFSAWQYSTLLLIAVAINALTAFIGALFSASKKTGHIATTTILAAIVNTALNAIMIKYVFDYSSVIGPYVAGFLSLRST